MIIPQKDEFVKTARKGLIYPVYAHLPEAECLSTPLDIYEKLTAGEEYTYLLESGRLHPKTGRYSFIGTMPFLVFQSKANQILLRHINNFVGSNHTTYHYQGYPLPYLREILNRHRTAKLAGLPNFTGGAVGYFAYDICHFFEKLPHHAVDDLKIPDIIFVFSRVVVVFDHIKHDIKVVATPLIDSRNGKDKYEAAYEEAIDLVRSVTEEIEQLLNSGLTNKFTPPGYNLGFKNNTNLWKTDLHGEKIRKTGAKRNSYSLEDLNKVLDSTRQTDKTLSIESNFTQSEFETIVWKAKKYIKAGDIFQANLSQRLSANMFTDPWLVYKTLSRINPSPFACYLNFGEIKIVSSSPERLLRVQDRQVETRPIAGTRPRGKDGQEDMDLCRELILSEKERAEHIMLVDLERNDLGRVCEYGSVQVDELMVLEEYSHVIHIVSNVRGILRPTKDRFDLIAASFPGGTITGTPKVRCMEIIDELEPVTRGIYTGSIGYLSFNGDMDLNIVIRTFLIIGERAYVQVGAGIVADSDPTREYYETLYKAEALLKTLQLTTTPLILEQ